MEYESETHQCQSLIIEEALLVLNKRDRTIIRSRFLCEKGDGFKTLHELGDMYHISKERVRQLEASAIIKLSETIKSLVNTDDIPMLLEDETEHRLI